jgi:hypothetical protein
MTLKPEPQRVMAPEIAKTLRQALIGVVMEGTATRLRGAYHAPNGTLLAVGGKTGTGDNRLDCFWPRRPVDLTARRRPHSHLCVLPGDRFFGTITAYVPGTLAGTYHFTSARAVQLLNALEPQLDPLLEEPAGEAAPMPITEASPALTGLRKSSEGSAD